MILVGMSFATGFLDKRMAANEFSTNKQFMLTTGLQIDDMAWTVGRTQTVRYSSNYGTINWQTAALNYTFQVSSDNGATWTTKCSNLTAMLMFKMPTSFYSLGSTYFERLMPTSGSFLQQGSSAPTCQVFCVEKVPMRDGSYIRIVAVPSIRVLNSTIASNQGTTNYVKFYLPLLQPRGSSPYNSQSVTLIGNDVTKYTITGVNQVKITVEYSNAASDFDSSFFKLDSTTIILNSTTSPKITASSVVEIYLGQVIFTIGQV
jgi:hypothetical protein